MTPRNVIELTAGMADGLRETVRDRAAVPAASAPLSEWQDHIGRWAAQTFGPSPTDVLAARLVKEAVDVLDRAVVGDSDATASALGGVLVVASGLAARLSVDLGVVLQSEQIRNQLSSWAATAHGQWQRRNSDQALARPESELVIALAARRVLTGPEAAQILVGFGLPLTIAHRALITAGVAADQFQSASPAKGPLS